MSPDEHIDAPAPGNGRGFVVCERFDDLGSDGAPARLGIMGGTFDPIHIGHLACAEQAREALGLDAVVFIPTGVPAFKRDRDVTPAADRLAMCRLAVLPNRHFDVSPLEVDRPGVTYAVDTLRILRAHYPDNVELFFITGADSILSIARWRESAAIASLVRFIAVTRPGYVVTDAFKAELASLGDYDVAYLEVTALAISSSDLRRRVHEGLSLRYLTMLPVCDYIHRRGLYRGPGAAPFATSPDR
ncbi:MAG: nicotinate-nucleotide adenylyltransferase [Eggerthellaceae bacterium]|nr:nicotinate-nucleotide adenylyltransferase [Eggerthellaceae bacterium]